jgi:Fe2+ or Zn2+ uptake regulation protein
MPHLHPHQENFIEKALEKLKQNAFKSTRARNDILEAIAKHDKALSAYELQDLLKNEGKNYSAITIYRVIETLLELDIVHKVHSINSFMKCCEHKNHLHRLLVCKSCHSVKPVERAATELHISGFAQLEVIDEVLGLCEKCH